MKKAFLIFSLAIFSLCVFGVEARAQKSVEPKIQRDTALEADAIHNLQVARQYFDLKKAYKASLLRCEEIIAANPEFSRIDEVYYLIGLSSYYLAEGKGKQKIDLTKLNEDQKLKFAPEKLREDAVATLSLLVEKFPQSQFKPQAEKALKEIESKNGKR